MASPTAFALVNFTIDNTYEVVPIECVKDFDERNAYQFVNHRLNKNKIYKVKWRNQWYDATLHAVGDIGESVFLHYYIITPH